MSSLPQDLAPPDALKGVRVGVSVSVTPDLARLGLLESHFRLALGEIARSVLVLGGTLAYGGHLEASGYTAFLVSELKRYGRRDRPLAVCLSWPEHRRFRLSRLEGWRRDLGLFGELTCLDPCGQPIAPHEGRGEHAEPETDPAVITRSLTSLRTVLTGITHARVLIGGKRVGFLGEMPGVLEEALLALDAQQPLYLAGGFGGVTLDILRTVSPDATTWLPTYAQSNIQDARYEAGLNRVAVSIGDNHWAGLRNGLCDTENYLLAMTHRASEIAALVSLGLSRLAKEGRLRC
jgi:hypothetical protein